MKIIVFLVWLYHFNYLFCCWRGFFTNIFSAAFSESYWSQTCFVILFIFEIITVKNWTLYVAKKTLQSISSGKASFLLYGLLLSIKDAEYCSSPSLALISKNLVEHHYPKIFLLSTLLSNWLVHLYSLTDTKSPIAWPLLETP